MKILNVTYNLKKGGVERAFVNYAKMLTDLGHQVINLTPQNIEFEDWLKKENLSFLQNNAIKKKYLVHLFDILKLRRLVKTKFDLILTHNARSIKTLRKAFPNTKIIAVSHGGKLEKLLTADYVINVTRTAQKTFSAKPFPKQNIFYLPNLIDLPSTLPVFSKKNHKPIIATLGRAEKEKGHTFLLEAFNLLKEQGYNFAAKIGGDGSELPTLKKQAGDNSSINFCGMIENPAEFLKDVDIFVLSSIYESFGIMLLEAAISGCAIVSTDCDGPLEIINHSDLGIITKKADVNSLANGIKHFLDHPESIEIYAKNIYEHVALEYSYDNVIKKFDLILKQIFS